MKKNIFYTIFFNGFWVLLLGIVIPVEGQTYGPNLVVNPGFEDGVNLAEMTPWAFSANNVALETTHVVSGRSIRFSGGATSTWGNASQVVTVEAGATYKFGYTGFVLDAYGPQGGTLTSTRSVSGQVFSGNSAPSGATPILVLPIASNVAITASGEFTVPVGVTQVFIRLIKGYGIATVDDVILQIKQWNIIASSNNTSMGNVSGGGLKSSNSTVSLTATPETGYHFVNWTENGSPVSTDATYEFTASADRTLVANFEPDVVAITAGTTNASDIPFTTSDVTVASGATLNINATKTLKSVTVAAGGRLTLNSAQSLTATNGILLQNDASGTASFVDERTDDTPTPIAGTVEQTIIGTDRNWYVAVPVTGKTASDITLSGASIVKRNEISASWDPVSAGTTLTAGVGYIAVASATSANTSWTLAGNLHSGKVEVGVTRSGESSTGFNLLGNPYPSYLNWEQVLNLNATNASTLQPTIWYRTATYNEDLSKYDYTFNTYNSVARVATPTNTTGYIPPMQAFWVRANSAGTVTFTNAMRSHGDGANNKLKAPKISTQQLVRLQVSGSSAVADEAVLYFDSNAQNSFDAYDSPKMFNNVASKPEIFTYAGLEKLVINGMNEIPYDSEIPLGFVAGIIGDYSITRTEFTNFNVGTRIMLKDALNPAHEFELTEGASYNFSSHPTTASTSRFSLIFRAPSLTTDVDNASEFNAQVFVNAANQITIIAPEKSNYAIYNGLGQLIENGAITSNSQNSKFKHAAGVYIVKVNNQSTRVIIK